MEVVGIWWGNDIRHSKNPQLYGVIAQLTRSCHTTYLRSVDFHGNFKITYIVI